MADVTYNKQKNLFSSQVMIDPRPSWTTQGSRIFLEHDLTGFKLKGPGWYINADGTAMLIVPSQPKHAPFLEKIDEEMSWTVFVYDSKITKYIFDAIVNAPVRVDNRPA